MAGYGFNTGLDGHRIKPLTEKEAEEIAEGLKIVYGSARETMLRTVSRRLGRGVTQYGWAERKTQEILLAHEELRQTMDRASSKREKLLDGVMDRAYVSGNQKFANDMHSILGQTAHTSPNSTKVGYILADLNQGLGAAERRILRQFDDVYANTIGAVSAKMATGVINTRQAVGEALTEFTDEGVTGFVDRGGHHWTLENYSEMAVLTAIERSTIAGYVDTMEEYGYDLAIIDGHSGACPICAAWEGVIVSVSGNNTEYPSLDEAESAGVFHPRCLHGITTYYPDISHPPKGGFRNEPREIEEPSAEYTARSKQRYMERQIRKYKDRAIVAQTPQQKLMARNKVKQWEEALDDLIENQPSTDYLYRHQNRERGGAVQAGSTDALLHIDQLAINARKVIPIEGFQDIVCHGNKFGFSVKDTSGNDIHSYSTADFAMWLKESGMWKGGPIRLLACEAGADGSVTAQGLADLLGTTIMAPSDVLWIDFDGNITIGPNDLTNTGEWRIFTPRDTK